MITFTAKLGSGKVVGIGITDENIERLKKEPISLTAEQLKLPYDLNILVFWGKSNREMEKAIHEDGRYGPDIRTDVDVNS